MFAERCTNQSCNSDCEACRQARQMVNGAIVASVKDVIVSLESHDLVRAKWHIAGLVELLDDMPKSTAELVGPQKLAELSGDLHRAFWEVEKESEALARLRGVLLVWAEDSSGPVN